MELRTIPLHRFENLVIQNGTLDVVERRVRTLPHARGFSFPMPSANVRDARTGLGKSVRRRALHVGDFLHAASIDSCAVARDREYSRDSDARITAGSQSGCIGECMAQDDAEQNDLLDALPADIAAQWLPKLEPIEMPLGKVLYEPGIKLSHVYFPTTSIVSLLYVLENGASAEIAVVGYEGIVGVSIFMGGNSTPSRAVVQSAGRGLRLKSDLLLQEFNRAGPVLHLLLRYTQALITQMAQTAVCNRHHSLDQQLCRWLLLSLDRLRSSELVMTQELIANMLGVRREGVTEAAGHLHKAGLIRYRRGHVTVIDRPRLEQRVCECYAVVKKEYDRLLPASPAH